jgi:uncharacterized protein YqcC (DUF446 family)
MNRYTKAAASADRIERELRALHAWQDSPPPDSAFDSKAAFFADTMSFYQWLQFVLLPRVRAIVAAHGAFPESSEVGAYAVRELDGCDEAADLVQALCDFDECIEGHKG